MKNIAKPPARPRTDGIIFDPPRTFELPPTRFNDLPRDTALYSPDELDRNFVQRSEQMKLCDPYPPLSLRVVSILIGGFEMQAAHFLRIAYLNNKNSALQGGGGVAHNTAAAITPGNRDLLEKIKISIPDVLRNAGETDHPLAAHASASDAAKEAVIRKVHDSVRGHWMEKRCAMGTALSSQLRPVPHDSGMLANTVMGDHHEPFLDREIQDPLVVWRVSAEHELECMQRAGESAKAIKAATKRALKQTDTAKRDRATTRHFVRTAHALMQLVLQREEMRMEHTEIVVAELALARKCRQLPPHLFSAGAISGQASPVSTSKKTGSNAAAAAAGSAQQQLLFTQQFFAAQQLVPLVAPPLTSVAIDSHSSNSATMLLQPQQLDPLVEELLLAFGGLESD